MVWLLPPDTCWWPLEEVPFRGYALLTLGASIGFWPAAAVLAVVSGSLHVLHDGGTLVSGLSAALYALFAAFTLRRTAPCGLPQERGLLEAHLLAAHERGPVWLTGGTNGPEGSVIGFAVLVLARVVFARRFPSSSLGRPLAI